MHEFINKLWEWIKDAIMGFSLSIGGAAIAPEVIHGFAVIITGLISTVCIFFVNRWLKNKFPVK